MPHQHQVLNLGKQLSPLSTTTTTALNWYNQGNPQFDWVFWYCQNPLSLEPIIESICKFTAKAVCDGSIKDSIGSAAAVLTNVTTEVQTVIPVNVPTCTGDCNSFCAKLYGIYVVVYSVFMLEKAFHLKSGKVTIACDNKAAVHCSNWSGPTSVLLPEYNLISAIRLIKNTSNIDFEVIHVAGHQD
jgi:hypothetical protein